MNLGYFFDSETTGIPNWKVPSENEEQPHLTQLGAILVDMDTKKEISSLDVVLKPNGWTIPDEVVALNGLTTDYCAEVGVPEDEAVRAFLMLGANIKRYAYNTTFDNRIIRIATKRYFPEKVQDDWKAGEYECAMMAAKKDMGVRSVKLGDAYEHYFGERFKGAHDALSDTRAALRIWFAIQDAQESQSVLDISTKETPNPIPGDAGSGF